MRVLHIGKYYPRRRRHGTFPADLLPALHAQGVAAARWCMTNKPHRGGQWPAPDAKPPIYARPVTVGCVYAPLSPAFPFWLAGQSREFPSRSADLHLPNTSAFWRWRFPPPRRLPWIIHWHADVVASLLDRRLALA